MSVQMITYKNREEWLKGREKGIGGSDASCILGLNPWKSNVELFEEICGKPSVIKENDAMKYGTEAEKYLRELFRLDYPQFDVYYEEFNSWTNDNYPFAKASLDGWLTDKYGRKGIWECKTTEISSRTAREKWEDRIPDNYYCQLLHYFMVTEFDFAILKAQLKSRLQDGSILLRTKHYTFERKEVIEDIEWLTEKEQEFWEAVKQGKRPALILPNI